MSSKTPFNPGKYIQEYMAELKKKGDPPIYAPWVQYPEPGEEIMKDMDEWVHLEHLRELRELRKLEKEEALAKKFGGSIGEKPCE